MRSEFLGYPLDPWTLERTTEELIARAQQGRGGHHVSLNAGKIVLASQDERLAEIMRHADVSSADGMGVVWAARFLGRKVPERVAGIDLMETTLARAEELGLPVYFFGAKPEVLRAFLSVVSSRFPRIVVAGSHDGYAGDESEVARDAAAGGARLLYVAVSSPKKEQLVGEIRELLPSTVMIGVGGSFDVWAGVTSRAPKWMQRAGFEWLYRFIQEPRRMWPRYVTGNLRFAKIVLSARFGKGSKAR